MEEIDFKLDGVEKMASAINSGVNLFWQAVQLTEDPAVLGAAYADAVKVMRQLNGTGA